MKKIYLIIICAIIVNNEVVAQISRYDYVPTQPIQNTYVPLPYFELLKSQELADQRKREEYKQIKEKATACYNHVKEYYKSFVKYPELLIDGWHRVTVTNNFDFCSERNVLVSKNKIIRYVIHDDIGKQIAFSPPIKNAQSHLKFEDSDGSITGYFDVYFIESIIDSTSKAPEPIAKGAVSFWINFNPFISSKWRVVNVYINNQLIGSINECFKEAEPICGQLGTLQFTDKVGKYQYRAEAGNHKKWEGYIEIKPGGCSTILLNK
jgi:hypothetical protein